MRNIKLAEVQKSLQAIANQKGRAGYEKAKAAYLDDVLVVDDNDNPIEKLDFEATFPEAESVSVTKSDDAVAAQDGGVREVIRDEVSKALKSAGGGNFVKAKSIVVSDPFGGIAASRGRVKHVSSPEVAHSIGMWFAASLGNERAKSWCRENGLSLTKARWKGDSLEVVKGSTEGSNTAGGFLVNPQHDNEFVVLREKYGVFRRNARVMPMSSDTLDFKRQTSAHTAYPVGEASAGTESTAAFDKIQLVARKWMVLNTVSTELSEDTAIAFGDIFTNDVAYAFALAEDQAGFIGDGTSTYNGIVGLKNALINLSGTIANIAGVYDCAGSTWANATDAMIRGFMALLPAYADSPNAKFYCHKVFYHSVLERLAYTAGGATVTEVVNGVPTAKFRGYQVEFVQAMPSSGTADTIDLLFGDLSLSSYFGDRKGMTIATSDSALNAFEQDEIAWRATTRFDIVNANVGNASATAASRVAGPVVGLVVL